MPSAKRSTTCTLILGACLTVLGFGSLATAQVRSWSGSHVHTDGTTHWYEAVSMPAGVTWAEASRAAATAGGHLATITSAAENTAIVGLIQDASLWSGSNGPWIGGIRWSTTPTVWGWGEFEPFAFVAWGKNQPGSATKADRIHFGGSTATTAGTWANAPGAQKLPGFVIEYAGPTLRRTVGLLRRDAGSFDGYTLFSPLSSKKTYLVDPRGRVVNTWTSNYRPGIAAYLLPNGNLLRCGKVGNTVFGGAGDGGIVEEFDWQGNLVWQFQHSSATYCLHHDVERLPNGNTLMIAWELKTVAEAIAAGRRVDHALPKGTVWPTKIIEVQPTGKASGKIVWEWHAWDHLIQDFDSTKANYGPVAKHPELIDVNYTLTDGRPDWLHANAVAYNAKLDQIVISFRALSEIWVIDHSTTTKEAASHTGGKSGKGGDLLYRWGNPVVYRAGTTKDQILFSQHDAHWIPDGLPGAGNLLIFSNGTALRNYSSVDEIVLPKVDAKGNYPMTGGVWGPAAAKWSYTAPNKHEFYSPFVSGAQRLPNGNTLICSGWNGWIFEVTASGKTVWDYMNADASGGIAHQGDLPRRNGMFRSPRYAADYPGLKGKTLTPGEPIESHGSVLLVEGSAVGHRVKPGASVHFSLRASNHPGLGYLVGTSVTPGLLQIDHRFVRMGWDPFLAASIWSTPPKVFQNYAGFLDAKGRGSATLAVPNMPTVVGTKAYTTFLVKDPKARSTLGMISNTVVVEIDS
ncbi:MAG: aryl-sulfate sulfotransferase [Planctomycetota bacterium]|jgi:hypothetical protein